MQINLTKQEAEQLNKTGECKIGEITINIIPKKKLFIEEGQKYWCLKFSGIDFDIWKNHSVDEKNRARDNVYLTESEAKKADDKRLALGTIRQYMRDNDLVYDDVDWEDENEKCQIRGWNYEDEKIMTTFDYFIDCSQHNLIFRTLEDRKKVTDNCADELRILLRD